MERTPKQYRHKKIEGATIAFQAVMSRRDGRLPAAVIAPSGIAAAAGPHVKLAP
jgi:hypothetical protein